MNAHTHIPGWRRSRLLAQSRARATVLLVTLGILTVLSVMGSSFALLMQTEREATLNYLYGVKARMIAEDGIAFATTQLQESLATSLYSQLDDQIYGWAYVTGDKDYQVNAKGEYVYWGNRTLLTDETARVSLPFSQGAGGPKYVDLNFNGKEDPDETLPPEYFDATGRSNFSGLPADGYWRGGGDVPSGTFVAGGDRYKLKIISANAQLSLNFLNETRYDFMVFDAANKAYEGTGFKFALIVLGNTIAKKHGLAKNPLRREVAEEIWKLRQGLAEAGTTPRFTSKDQIRDLVEDQTPGAWRYVRDYLTVHAWPGHDPLYAGRFNTIVPNVPEVNPDQPYKDRVGDMDELNALKGRGKPALVSTKPVTLPPLDVNVAPEPVIASVVANIAGDARYWYFSGAGLAEAAPPKGVPNPNPLVPQVWTTEKSASKFMHGNERMLASTTKKRHYLYGDINTITGEYGIPRRDPTLSTTVGAAVFKRNPGILNYLLLDPLPAPLIDTQDTTTGVKPSRADYGLTFARALVQLRPFRSWADFDKRVIQDVVVKNKGALSGVGQIVRPFSDFKHPWNSGLPGFSARASDINITYFEQWYYEAVGDLIRAAFNPTPKITKYNPDHNYYQRVDRSDLVYWTVPFTFQSPGVYEISAVGEIQGHIFNPTTKAYEPRPLVVKQYQATVSIADIVRHHSQRDFLIGVPPNPGPWTDPKNAGESSVTRLMQTFASSTVANVTESNTAVYPLPADEQKEWTHLDKHVPQMPGTPAGSDAEKNVYHTYMGTPGSPSATARYRVNGWATEALWIRDYGWVQVRPQDRSPLEEEMHDMIGPPGVNRMYLYNGPGQMLAGRPNNLNFWLPMNESLNTIFLDGGNWGYIGGGSTWQTARIGSVTEGKAGLVDHTWAKSSSGTDGIRWLPDGVLMRAFDYGLRTGKPHDDKYYPAHLRFPSGVGAERFGDNKLGRQSFGSGDPSTDTIIGTPTVSTAPAIPARRILNTARNSAAQYVNQDDRQQQTNVPYYEGTIEFWYKPDVDQYDQKAPGWTPADDRSYLGFTLSNTMVQRGKRADIDRGLQGVQMAIYKDMNDRLRVTRIYFVDALRQSGSDILEWLPYYKSYPDPDDDTLRRSGAQKDDGWISTFLQTVGDICDKPDDLGLIWARTDFWVQLDPDDNVKNPYYIRPHQWYHIAVSYRSDATTATNLDRIVNIFINGVRIDPDTVSLNNYPAPLIAGGDLKNDGVDVDPGDPPVNFFKLIDPGPPPVVEPWKRIWGTLINDIDPEPVLYVGAVSRRQLTEKQRQGRGPGAVATTLNPELFQFAEDVFVAPCNGTMDAFRITSHYLDDTGEIDANNRLLRSFARYNTIPGTPVSAFDELGTYENGFVNTWGRDVRIANVTWNEYRPSFDTVLAAPFATGGRDNGELLFNEASPIKFDFINYPDRDISSVAAKAVGSGLTAVQDASGSITGMGATYPASGALGKVVLAKDGMFVYRARFYPNSPTGFPTTAALSSAILDEVSMQVLTPVRFLSFEEVYIF